MEVLLSKCIKHLKCHVFFSSLAALLSNVFPPSLNLFSHQVTQNTNICSMSWHCTNFQTGDRRQLIQDGSYLRFSWFFNQMVIGLQEMYYFSGRCIWRKVFNKLQLFYWRLNKKKLKHLWKVLDFSFRNSACQVKLTHFISLHCFTNNRNLYRDLILLSKVSEY